ncbi:BTB/POZ domain-containing protein 9 [Fasciola hepatica]|uniref:BTB/POZ domain-containing protein 9 n=1 Tax=Fasciola hepatica TaxID=6192 RepID=A0A4E0RM25_FASHE|nr:BTB/POZ domain-containing protein 9 [Fasciola hepatica]
MEARQQQMIRRCVRFELMSLTELLTEVRASKLVSPDDLLDAISRQAKCPDALPHRGWMLPGVNLASPRFACSLISGEEGGYPYFFVDDMEDEHGSRGLDEMQLSLSALDLTTALANGIGTSGSVQVPSEPVDLDNEEEEEEEEDEDEEDEENDGESRSRANNLPLTNWHRAEVTDESEPRAPGVDDSGTTPNRTHSSINPRYAIGDQTTSNVGSVSETSNLHLFTFMAPAANRRQISFPAQSLSNADWYPIIPPESRISELNQYSAHVRGTHPRRNTHSFVTPHTYSNQQLRQSSGRRPHLTSSLFTSNTSASGNATGSPHWPLVGVSGRTEADRSIRLLYPVNRRGTNFSPQPPPPHSEHDVVRHSLDDPDAHIVIRLGKPSIVNTIRMQLWDREVRCYSYYVEVSLDLVTWHRIVDYRSYPCRSWQTLHFPARVIHYIRVTGTRNTANRTFHLITFRCFYTESVCEQVDGFLIPTHNVASVNHGATVLEGVSRNRNSLIDGNARMYDWNSGYTCHQLGNGAIVVQLAQPFLLRSMRLLLWDLDDRTYSYSVHVSTNREDWRLVHDATRERCRSWQIITFPLQLVTFIRVVGSHNTANEVFHLVHLECPYPPAEQSVDASPNENDSPEAHSAQDLPAVNSEFAGIPTSSDAPSESNSMTGHPSYQATQATEMMDHSSVLALDAVTNSSVYVPELETRPNSPPIPTALRRSDTAESLPQLAPVARDSFTNLPDSDQLPMDENSLEREPDGDRSMYTSRLSLDPAEPQLGYNNRMNLLPGVDVVHNLPIPGVESEPNRPLSRHLSIGSSVCQLSNVSATGSNRARSGVDDHSRDANRRARISRSSPAAQEPTQETTSLQFDFS